MEIKYHGTWEFSGGFEYPQYVQWNYNYPVLSLNDKKYSKILRLTRNQAFEIEKTLGRVEDILEFESIIKNQIAKKG